jgi:single-strand DNA-binding protein
MLCEIEGWQPARHFLPTDGHTLALRTDKTSNDEMRNPPKALRSGKTSFATKLKKMNSINQVTVVGRLIRDPEVRFAATGTAIASFSVATNHRYQDKVGQWKDETAFIPCTGFGRTAEQLSQKHKGEPVLITGRLRAESWLKEGVNHSRLVLVAETINFILPGTKSNGGTELGELPLSAEEVKKAIPF